MAEVRHARVQTNGIALHVAEAGPPDGPLVILLHGFPEHWRGWRAYIEPLAEAGYRVVAPDQRGYGLSDKPKGVAAYDLDVLAADVAGLADHYGRERFTVIGHDWGASVGWWLASSGTGRLERLVAINAPHPAVWREGMRGAPEQRRRSAYVGFFNLPRLPEALLSRNNYAGPVSSFTRCNRPSAFPPEELELYREAWRQPGALTGMLNWYRALLRKAMPPSGGVRVEAPTLLIWGEQDPFAVRELAEQSLALCDDGRPLFLPTATHWSQHEESEACLAAMLDFLGRPVQRRAGPTEGETADG